MDIVFMVDSSGSVLLGNFNRLLMFVDHLLRQMGFTEGHIRAGLLTFSDDASVVFHLQKHRSQAAVTKGIMSATYRPGMTNLAAALKKARVDMFQHSSGDRAGIPNVGVLITDGFSSINPLDTIPQAEEARGRGIMLYAIGISLPDIDELNAITGNTDRVFLVDDFEGLPELAYRVKDAICKG